ncbi:MAG: NUDIX hydrolase [Anaerolineae bacterium]|nr:NUDIX hydrolase [Anaerolineae bacterium]
MSNTDKPNARCLGWEIQATDYPYENPWYRLRRDRLRLPNGTEPTFTYVTKSPAVFILPITARGELVLIRQYRYLVDTWLWEIPAGGSHDFEGGDAAHPDSMLDLVRRELREEIGGETEHILHLHNMFGATGILSMTFCVYLALNVRLSLTNAPEASEVIEVHALPIPQAIDLMRGDDIDALDGYIVLKHEKLLRTMHTCAMTGKSLLDEIETLSVKC